MAKIKIYVLRVDGIVQRYTIKRKNLKNYVKVSYRKKERRNVWIRKERKVKLEKEKRKVKPKEPKERKVEKPKKAIKQVWHIKYKYKSERGKSHDLITEVILTTIRFKPLSEEEVKDLAEDCIHIIDEINEQGLPFIYTEIEVGLESEEIVESDVEDTYAEFKTYSHELD